MKVMLSKSDDGCLCSWRAELPKHRRFQGSTMAARAGHIDLPHDLAQFVVEATLGLEEGFWNLVANGATLARWRALPVGEELVVEWLTRRLPMASVRVRRAPTQRRPRRAARS